MQNFQLWMPAVLSLFGTLIVVVFTAWLNTRMLSAQVEALRSEFRGEIASLRAEMRQGFAELRLEFRTELSQVRSEIELINHRLERLEDGQGRLFHP